MVRKECVFAPAIRLYPGSHTRFSMIKSIHGVLQACHPDYALIRVGGFGIQVFAPATTISHLGETGTEVDLHTHFHMREDSITLYGFLSEMDRDAFEQLIAISGVGPRVAL